MHQNLLCILIHILKTPTQSFSSMPPWLEAFFFICLFFCRFFCLFVCFIIFCSQIGAVSLSVLVHNGKPDLFTFELWRSWWILLDCRVRKRGENGDTFLYEEPKLPDMSSKCVTECISWDTQTSYVHGWHILFFFPFLLKAMVTWAVNWYHTHDTPKHTKILLSLTYQE